jgi:hypothetical protein
MFCILTEHYLGDKTEKNEMGGACSMYGERKVAYRMLVGKPEGKISLEDSGVDGSIILRGIFRKGDGNMY